MVSETKRRHPVPTTAGIATVQQCFLGRVGADSLMSEVEESPYASIRKAFVIWQMRNAR